MPYVLGDTSLKHLRNLNLCDLKIPQGLNPEWDTCSQGQLNELKPEVVTPKERMHKKDEK